MKALWKLRPEILLHPNIPKPLHTLAPRNILGNRWWNATRKRAYRSTHFHCQACGVPKEKAKYRQWLEGHELYSINYPLGRLVYLETVPLCHFCHNYIHSGRLAYLLSVGSVHQAKYAAIIKHGDAILDEAGLVSTEYKGPVARWENWRLVLFSTEYKPNFDSHEEWKAAFGHD